MKNKDTLNVWMKIKETVLVMAKNKNGANLVGWTKKESGKNFVDRGSRKNLHFRGC